MNMPEVELRTEKIPAILGPIMVTFLIFYLPQKILTSPNFSRTSAIMQTVLLTSLLLALDVLMCLWLFYFKISIDDNGMKKRMFHTVEMKWNDITKLSRTNKGRLGLEITVFSTRKEKIVYGTRSYRDIEMVLKAIKQRLPDLVIEDKKGY